MLLRQFSMSYTVPGVLTDIGRLQAPAEPQSMEAQHRKAEQAHCVVALREAHDEIMSIGQASRLLNVCTCWYLIRRQPILYFKPTANVPSDAAQVAHCIVKHPV